MMIPVTGRVRILMVASIRVSPATMVYARRRLDSQMTPRTRPRIMAELLNLQVEKTKPMRPEMAIRITSTAVFLVE